MSKSGLFNFSQNKEARVGATFLSPPRSLTTSPKNKIRAALEK